MEQFDEAVTLVFEGGDLRRSPAGFGFASGKLHILLQCPQRLYDRFGQTAYKGRWLVITGRVDRIAKDLLNQPYVLIRGDGDSGFRQVQCFVGSSDGNLNHLRRGQSVSVMGKCDG